ncbi:MAG: sigma-70 family RNA polymerase sigma factor [Planctomycetes bacterium]|nr:sigma-70 family RNA polymerase sigma factor [Planctomycetota bacterium]
MTDTSIEHLTPQLARGDEEAFRSLVRALGEPLFAFAASRTRDSTRAQDVVQTAFIRVYRQRANLQQGTLRAYCYRIVENLTRDNARDAALRGEREREAASMRPELASSDPQRAAMAREAWQAALNLPGELRDVVLLHHGQGLSMAEAGAVLDIPKGTVQTRLQRAMDSLREKLGATALALPALGMGDLLGQHTGFAAPVAAPPSFISSVETAVMATIAQKSIFSTTAIIIFLLLMMGGFGLFMVFGWPQSRANQLVSQTTPDDGNERRRTDSATSDGDRTKSSPAKTPANTPTDAGKSTDAPPVQPPVTPVQPEAAADKLNEVRAKISGRVVDSRGRPVFGMQVGVVEPDTRMMWYENAMHELQPRHWIAKVPQGTGTSDAQGRFTINLNARRVADSGPVLFALLAVPGPDASPDFGRSYSDNLWVDGGGSAEGVEIVAWRSSSVVGNVVRAGGDEGVAGVPVVLACETNNYHLWGIARRTVLLTTVSDSTGAFRFDGLQPGKYGAAIQPVASQEPETPLPNCMYTPVSVTVRADTPGIAGRDTQEGGTAGPLRLEYHGHTLRFRTKPAVAELNAEFEFASENSAATKLRPDADGVFSVAGLRPGLRKVLLQNLRGGKAERAVNTGAEDIDLGVIELTARILIRGKVLDPQGRPCEGVMVVQDEFTLDNNLGLTREDGTFCHELETAGEKKIRAVKFGLIGETVAVAAVGGGPEAVLKLAPGVTIRARTTLNGGPLPASALGQTGRGDKVMIFLSSDEPDPDNKERKKGALGLLQTTLADYRGARQFVVAHPGRYKVHAELGNLSGETVAEIVAGGSIDVVVDIKDGGGVSGCIIGRDGLPYAERVVRLAMGGKTNTDDNEWESMQARTDSQGAFHIKGVSAGTYYLRVDTDSALLGQRQLLSRQVKIIAGQQTEKNLDLSAEAGANISGRVTLGGKTLFNQVIIGHPGDVASMRGMEMKANGDYLIADVEPGLYYVWFMDRGTAAVRVRETISITAGRDVEFSHDYPSASLSGSVQITDAPSDFNYSDVSVSLACVQDDNAGLDVVGLMVTAQTPCDKAGNFKFSLLPAGAWNVTAGGSGMARTTQLCDVQGAQTTNFRLATKAGRIEVTVREMLATTESPADGIPPNCALLSLTDAQGQNVQLPGENRIMGITAGSVRRIACLAPGEYTLEIVSFFSEPWTGKFTVLEGEVTNLPITLHRAATIRLSVQNTELDAVAVQRAAVEVYNSANKPVHRMPLIGQSTLGTLPDDAVSKTLTITPLAAGTYRVIVTVPGYRPLEASVTVARGGVSEQAITLTAR